MTAAGIGDGSRTFTYAPPPKPSQDKANQYKRLFSVTVTHNYYSRGGGLCLCPDFRVIPTQATAEVMASLGLVLKNEGAGFSVYYLAGMLNGIFGYLRREAAQAPEAHPGFWSRLTFLMLLTNPEFVGITALPISLTQARANLYGSNRFAHSRDAPAGGPADAAAVLSRGDYMSADALYDLIGGELDLSVPHETARVTVADISGAIVMDTKDQHDAKLFESGTQPYSRKHAVLDFSSQPNDLYTITLEDSEGGSIPGPLYPGGPLYPRTMLYVPTDGGSMALLDMLFTRPTEDSTGIYPIPSMFGPNPPAGECGDRRYQLPFDARQTYWHYYVVSQIPGAQLQDLKIEGRGAQFVEHSKVPLPDGSLARLFTTSTALPLRQNSAQRFHLSGNRSEPGGQQNPIRLVRLPVAPASPVWPVIVPAPPVVPLGVADESMAGISEMFVYV